MSGFSQYQPKDGRRQRERPNRVQPGPVSQVTETRTPRRDKGEAPSGYEQEVWSLALLFEERAWADGIELPQRLPLIYREINDLVTRYGVRGQTFRHEIAGCHTRLAHSRLAEHCWLHYPPLRPAEQKAGVITWYQMVEVIILEFWSRIWDEHALDYFRQYFVETGQLVAKHWNNLRIAESARANHQKPPPRQRRAPGATMADASKEG